MKFRSKFLMKPSFTTGIFLFVLLIPLSLCAPALDDDESEGGCYYMFAHYEEGDRILTNEPCLNCTCHNSMLMCYLRVCPFTRPIGQDCTVEKRPDQCCPTITCPEVPVSLVTPAGLISTTSTPGPMDTDLAIVSHRGCDIEGQFYPDGAQVATDPNKPCELCYCIRNRTACVMQECILHVEGCEPVFEHGVCCPVRYQCDFPPGIETTTIAGLITSTVASIFTTAPTVSGGCYRDGDYYHDGSQIPTPGEAPCEHCYCMRGEIVCAVQDCGSPLENEGGDCKAIPPRTGLCCPEKYTCPNETITEAFMNMTTQPGLVGVPVTTPLPTEGAADTTSTSKAPEGIELVTMESEGAREKVTENLTSTEPPAESTESIEAQASTTLAAVYSTESPRPVSHASEEVHDEGVTTEMEATTVLPGSPTETSSTFPLQKESSEAPQSSTEQPEEVESTTKEIPVAPLKPVVSSTEGSEVEPTAETNRPPSAPTQEVEEEVGLKAVNATTVRPVKETYAPVTTTSEVETTTAGAAIAASSQGITSGEVTSEVEKESQTETVVTSEATESSLSDEAEAQTTRETPVAPPFAAQPVPTKEPEKESTKFPATEEASSELPISESSTRKSVSEPPTPALQETQNVTSTETILEGQEGTTPIPETQNQVMGQTQATTIHPQAEIKKPEISTQEPMEEKVTAKEKVGAPENMMSLPPGTTQTESVPETSTSSEQSPAGETISTGEVSTSTAKAQVPDDEVLTESPTELNKESERTTPTPLEEEIEHNTTASPPPSESSTKLPESDISSSIPVTSDVPEAGTEKISESSSESEEKETSTEGFSSSVSPSQMHVTSEEGTTEGTLKEEEMTTVTPEILEEKVSITTSEPELHDTVNEIQVSSEGPEHANKDVISQTESPTAQSQATPKATEISTESGVEVVTESATEPPITEPPEINVSTSAEELVTKKPEEKTPVVSEIVKEETTASPEEVLTVQPSHVHSTEPSLSHEESSEQAEGSRPPESTPESAGTPTRAAESITESSLFSKPQEPISEEPSEGSTEKVPISSEELPQSDEKPTEQPSEKEPEPSSASESSSTESVDEPEKTTTPSKPQDLARPESSTEAEDITKMASTIIPVESSSPSAVEDATKYIVSPTATEAAEGSTSRVPTIPASTEMETQSEETPAHLPSSTEQSEETQGSTPSPETITSTMSRIPGEGGCFVEGVSYKNGSRIPPSTPCQLACACQNSIVHCLLVHCPPAPSPNGIEKCRPIYTPETCCPKYECEEEPSSTPIIVTPESTVDASTDTSIVAVTPESTKPETQTHKPYEKVGMTETTEAVVAQESTTETEAAGVTHAQQRPQSAISQVTEGSVEAETETKSYGVSPTEIPETASSVPPAAIQQGKETTLTPIESKVGNETSEIPEVTTHASTPEVDVTVSGSETSRPVHDAGQTGDATMPHAISGETESSSAPSEVEGIAHDEKETTPPSAPTQPEIQETNATTGASEDSTKEPKVTAAPTSSTNATTEGVIVSTEGAEEITTNLPERISSPSGEVPVSTEKVPETSSPIPIPANDESELPGHEAVHEATSTNRVDLTTIAEEISTFASTVASIVESMQNATTEAPLNETSSTAKYPVTMSTSVTPSPAPWPYPTSTSGPPAMSNGACLFDSRVYMSAQQIPRDDPCDFCFCFRGDIICLQQSCPPPIPGCYEEPIPGFCCPRYECPVGSNSTAPPSQLHPPSYYHTQMLANQQHNASNVAGIGATGPGCEIQGEYYEAGQLITATSGPCLECRCGSGGIMECDPRECQPEPMLRKMIQAISSR